MNTFDGKSTPKISSHDTDSPPSLVEFMLKGWGTPKAKIQPLKTLKFFASRRERLSAAFPGELLIIPSGHLKVRANDTFYPFRPCSDFFYLTGCAEPDACLVFEPQSKGHTAWLFVEPNPGKTDTTFFTDRIKGELWEGPRPGVPECEKQFGLKCLGLPDLPAFLSARSAGGSKARVLRGHSAKTEAWVRSEKDRDDAFAVFLSEMRLQKDDQEVKELQAVIHSTQRGFEDVIRRMKAAKSERELEGVFFTRARMEGNDVGYGSIVASGDHACTLHWKRNDGKLQKKDLLLLDAGVEGESFYTADVTRTLPIGGKFSAPQKEVYELVLKAQRAAMKQVKPGNDFLAPNRAAMAVLAEGLVELGILKCTVEEALDPANQFYKRYTLHNVSHMLGLDVHDCAKARAESYKFGKLTAGMVLTVEPGLYFQPDDLTVPKKYRGIGVRIEDDVLVTAKGHRNLSGAIPVEVADVERWIRGLWKR